MLNQTINDINGRLKVTPFTSTDWTVLVSNILSLVKDRNEIEKERLAVYLTQVASIVISSTLGSESATPELMVRLLIMIKM